VKDYHPVYGARSDKYYVVGDFAAYSTRRAELNADYLRDIAAFRAKGAANIAGASNFSSDRSVREYCERIWEI
jgi:starch phosphorylase